MSCVLRRIKGDISFEASGGFRLTLSFESMLLMCMTDFILNLALSIKNHLLKCPVSLESKENENLETFIVDINTSCLHPRFLLSCMGMEACR